ncbi:serine/threonine-protein kinase [Streptomyces sp. NRRL B-24484]|uniref:serine/threonine-protein kinase n=1 Tax=Streptomyces sp. NRRL B-24484 TaxID=1463833 RepID=UPI0007C59C5E|nr:serine/threonine-protein kinase [Streptomyces sp. NRRL B-24484]
MSTDDGRVVAGRFELLARLGGGGMGTVWRAVDRELHREVALKEVRPTEAGGDRPTGVMRERVMREARALARLQHPHAVTIHQVVDAHPFPWLVMELVRGESLQDVLDRQGPLPPARAARIGLDLLAALEAAHRAGIQHRDVKPANAVVRPDGTAVLTDFGIAAVADLPALTAVDAVIGTPAYMAPERAAGEPGGPAADLWSLGMLLYTAVEGTSPLHRDTPLAALAAARDGRVPPPVRAGALAPVLRALLVPEPALRPDAGELRRMLAAVADGRVTGGAPGAGGDGTADAATVTAAPTPGPSAAARTPVHPPVHPPTHPDGPGRPGLPTVPGPAAPPDPSAATTPMPGARRRPVPALVAVLALAALGGGALTTLLLGPARDTRTPSRAAPVSSAPAGSPAPAPLPATPSGAPSGTPATSATATTPPSPAGSAGDGPGDGPGVAGEASAGTWIAQLSSVDASLGRSAAERELAAVRQQIPQAVLLRSDDFASLRPGYWVVYATGPFADGRAALAFCAAGGRTTDDRCVGRYLTHRAADLGLICRHAPESADNRCRAPGG